MAETKTGEIIFSKIGKIPQTGETYGLITLQISDDERLRIKINDSTEFEKLKAGTEVTVSYDITGDSKVPVANSIEIN